MMSKLRASRWVGKQRLIRPGCLHLSSEGIEQLSRYLEDAIVKLLDVHRSVAQKDTDSVENTQASITYGPKTFSQMVVDSMDHLSKIPAVSKPVLRTRKRRKRKVEQARYKDKGNEIAEDQFAQMTKQMDTFKGHLEDFAAKHKDEIKKDPAFRVQFQEMCASIGVDPLASSKGFWAEMLGVGDFYYELGVQIVEVCLATCHRNGGLISIDELRDRLVKSRSKKSQDISIDDLLRAIKKLKALGNGFSVIPLGGTYMIQSVPGELSMDHTAVIQKAQSTSHVTKSVLMKDLKWEEERANRALNYLVKEGLVWVDDQSTSERHYWFPSLFAGAMTVTT